MKVAPGGAFPKQIIEFVDTDFVIAEKTEYKRIHTFANIEKNRFLCNMKWLHNLLKGVSVTGALFVFQACYGSPQHPLYETGEAPMRFSLVSDQTGKPLEGIDILTKSCKNGDFIQIGTTGADGTCDVNIPFIRNEEGPLIHFSDGKGVYVSQDTTLTDLRERDIVIKMEQCL